MGDLSKVREYVTTVWNYNQAVVDAFDEEDYKFVEKSLGFNTWLLNKRKQELWNGILNMPLIRQILAGLKGLN